MIFHATGAFSGVGVRSRVVEAETELGVALELARLGGQVLTADPAGSAVVRLLRVGRGYIGRMTLAEFWANYRKPDGRPLDLEAVDFLAQGGTLTVERDGERIDVGLVFGAPALSEVRHG